MNFISFSDHAHFIKTLELEKPSIFQVYWAVKHQEFTEERSASVAVQTGQNCYELHLTGLEHIRRLRVDPVNTPARVLIKRIVIKQKGYHPIRLERVEAL